jgi:TonB-linked SusC/RagA family outer membrane protein
MPKLPSRPSPRTEASRVSQSQRRPRRRAARRAAPPAAHFVAALALAALPGALLVAAAPAALGAQPAARGTARVQGVVTSNNAPVGNAQVSLVGTRFGALSDNDGRYTINGVPAGSYTIRVQRIGFAPLTRPVTVADGQTVEANLAITAQAAQLTAVQVVGYTTEQRRDVSGAVASVRGDELRDQKVATVEEALRGRAPGVQIAASGQPGRPAQIIIRGQNGFNAPNPLYVVDGMYVGQQNPNLNPDDIASVEILKDASAAAQYGAQASNGVVVITTRRGSAGQNQFSVDTYFGFQQVPKTLPLAGAAEFRQVFLDAYANANAGRTRDSLVVPTGLTNPAAGVSTDWQNALFRNGAIQNYNLQASGGTSTANYLISGSVFDQKGTVLNTGFRRYSLRVNSEARRGRFTVGEALALSQANQSDFPNAIFGGQALPLIDVVQLLPLIPVRDTANPGGYGYGSDALPNYGVNPVAVLERNYLRRRGNQVLGTAYGEVRLFRNLRYRLNLGLNYSDSTNRLWTSSTQLRYLTPQLNGASLTQAAPQAQQLLYENLLNWDGAFGDGQHRLSAVAGQTSQRNEFQQIAAFRQGFTNEQLQQLNAGSTTGFTNSGFFIPFRTNSLLSRATYAFRDRYLATGSVRRDCSTRFSPGNRCGTFGAGSLGWVASEEAFFKSVPLLGGADFFKLRVSTGVLGDQNIGDLAYVVPVAQNQNYVFGGTTGVTVTPGGATQTVVANPNLRWQRNRSTDVGFDLGLFNNTLTLTADYYVNNADGVLVNIPIPASLGSTADPAFNAGKVRNAGFELGATHRAERGDWRFNNTFTLTTTRNRVVSLGNGGQPISRGIEGVSRTRIGEPIGAFYVLRTAGIFQSQADVDAHTASVTANGQTSTVKIQPDAKPGDLRFVDVNGDGRINADDRTGAGSPIPTLTTGLFMDARRGPIDVGLNLRGAFGNKIYNAVKLNTERVTGLSNVRAGYNPWTPTNTNTSTPRAVFGDAVNGNPATDRWLENGSFVRVQNLVLGYTLPQRLLEQARLGGTNSPRLYVNVQNLYTFTKYSGFDPDILGFGDPLARGIDDGLIYPNPRTVTFGFTARF